MFPGRNFCNPSFVEYGKNGSGAKDDFVYAVSSNGAWNNGDTMTIGRVPREGIGRLDLRDWEFFHGFDNEFKPIWRPRHDDARIMFRSPGRTSMTNVTYIPALDVYILPQWHRDYSVVQVRQPQHRKRFTWLEFYQAHNPWGPWSLFHQHPADPQGFYNPHIPSKFISRDGRKLWVFTAGNAGVQWYKLNMLPMTLEVRG